MNFDLKALELAAAASEKCDLLIALIPEGFKPGGMSLHNCMVPHGPDADAFSKASGAALVPHKLEDTLAFMFESRWRFRPTAFALGCGALDAAYAGCWQALHDGFGR